ncbi:MAG TPA: hypothetical protein VF615_02735 [Longimicrobiaceae bacterium]
MQFLRMSAVVLAAVLAACSREESSAIEGQWKRADNRVVLEFAEDGTVTRLATIPSMSGSDSKVTIGGTYSFPAEGKIQLTQGPDGPQNFDLRMFQDSMHLTQVGGQRETYFRDRGDKPSVTYALSAVDGQPLPRVVQAQVLVRPGFSRTMSLEYQGGEITLDPLTRTFVQTLTAVEQGMVRSGGSWTTTLSGSYSQQGETVTLRYEDARIPPAEGTIKGERLSYPTSIEAPTSQPTFVPGPVVEFMKR